MATTSYPPPAPAPDYPARLSIERPERLDRLTTAFRPILAVPIVAVIILLTATGDETVRVIDETGAQVAEVTRSTGGIAGALFLATVLLILFRRRYPRWWFDFARELTRFSTRVWAYLALLTDRYPSTEDEQAVHLELDYPDAEHDLNRWLPLVKWLLALPHVVVLAFLWIGVVVAVVIAWFAILFTGRYPRALFDYVVGVDRWTLRVQAYATLLLTDRYPPFSLA